MKTIKLDRTNPNAPLWIFFGVLGVLLLVNAVAPARPEQERTSFIYVLSTPRPTQPLPTADTRAMEATIADLRARVAELEARQSTPTAAPVVYQQMAAPQPTAGYVAHTTAGDIVIPPDATPVPPGASYDGPFLAPAATEPPSGPRLCDGFGDWRDFDPAYAASPACHK